MAWILLPAFDTGCYRSQFFKVQLGYMYSTTVQYKSIMFSRWLFAASILHILCYCSSHFFVIQTPSNASYSIIVLLVQYYCHSSVLFLHLFLRFLPVKLTRYFNDCFRLLIFCKPINHVEKQSMDLFFYCNFVYFIKRICTFLRVVRMNLMPMKLEEVGLVILSASISQSQSI